MTLRRREGALDQQHVHDPSNRAMLAASFADIAEIWRACLCPVKPDHHPPLHESGEKTMCGRFTYKMTWAEIHDLLEEFSVAVDALGEGVAEHPARYNIAPTQPIIVIFDEPRSGFSCARRG